MTRNMAGAIAATLACLHLGSACGGKDTAGPEKPVESTPPLTEATAQQLRGCVDALKAMDGAAPDWLVTSLAEGCPYACPEGMKGVAVAEPSQKLALLIEGCDFYCSEEAKKKAAEAPVRMRLPLAVEACGRDYYGLPEGQEAMLSLGWFVVQRIGRWLADARKRAETSDAQLVAELDEAMAQLRFPVGLPAQVPGSFEVPVVDKSGRVESRTYIVVTQDRVTAAATPVAVLTPEGARLTDDTGGMFPGTPVELSALAAEIARLEPLSPVRDVRPVIDDPEEDEEVEADEDAAVAEAEKPAEKGRRGGGAGDGLGVFAPAADAPVVLADAKLPASRVLDVMIALGKRGGFLGVGLESGELGAGARGLAAARIPPRGFAPRLLLFVDDEGFTISGTAATTCRIAKKEGGYDFDLLALRLRELAGPQMAATVINRRINVAAGGTATAQDLATALDVAADAGFYTFRAAPAEAARSWMQQASTASSTGEVAACRPAFLAAQVVTSKLTAEGPLHKQVIRRYVRRKLPQIRNCYQQQLAKSPKLEGTVVVTFEITGDGSVRNLRSTGLHKKVSACVGEALESIRFPAPKDGGTVKVEYPLELRPAYR